MGKSDETVKLELPRQKQGTRTHNTRALRNSIFAVSFALIAASFIPARAQSQEYGTGTRSLSLVGHLSLGSMVRADAAAFLVDVRLDQRPDRPYAYVAEQSGWAVVDLSNPAMPVVAALMPEEYVAELGGGISSIDYLEVAGKDIIVVGRADRLSVFDASGLANGEKPIEVASIGGEFGSLFAYKHSSGRALLIASSGGNAGVYDVAKLFDGHNGLDGRDARDGNSGIAVRLAEIPTPELPDSTFGYSSVFAAFHADSDADRFYGAGAGGYHVYDITNIDSVRYVTSANPAAVQRGLTTSPSADGRYLVTTAAYRTAPVRIFDLNPAIEGQFPTVRTSVGAWAANWHGFFLAHESRWPYVFVAAAEQGLQIFNARDVTDPYTVGSFSTSRRGEGTVNDKPDEVGGAVSLDIRNHDGLIAVGDQQTGVWFLKLDGFSNWDGRGWGFPNISSAQDWEKGPNGSSTFD